MPAGSWQARLETTAHLLNGRTVVDPRHEGPLRLFKALYPEGPRCCHHVLVHPPGGIVGGDRLELRLDLQPGSHLLLTTPGATRFYRSAGAQAGQCVQAQLGPGSRLEWLPHETQLHDGALASSRLCLDLAEGAEAIGWDLLALGLPACGAPFLQGHIEQHLEIRGRWLVARPHRGRRPAAARVAPGPGRQDAGGHAVEGPRWHGTCGPRRAGRGGRRHCRRFEQQRRAKSKSRRRSRTEDAPTNRCCHAGGSEVEMPPIMLPYPPSANHNLRHTSRGSYRTKEANSYRETVKERVWLTGLRVIHGHVGMIAELRPKLTKGGKVSKTCMDLDNAVKVLCDSLQGVLYLNDRQIKRMELRVGRAVEGGGLSVEVFPA